jgi:hypothetical protein
MGITMHRSTLLRLVIARPESAITAAPEILGIDDFALRRGHACGTIPVYAHTGTAIDVLPTRDAGRLAHGASGRRVRGLSAGTGRPQRQGPAKVRRTLSGSLTGGTCGTTTVKLLHATGPA